MAPESSSDSAFDLALPVTAPPAISARFPKTARLLKTDEFSSVFRLRPWARSQHFVLYARYTGAQARLGLVIGKKFAARAVTRNLIRRLAREAFRTRQTPLTGWDVLLRLHLKLDKKTWPSAESPALKQLLGAQIDDLLEGATKQMARRGKPAAAAANAPRTSP